MSSVTVVHMSWVSVLPLMTVSNIFRFDITDRLKYSLELSIDDDLDIKQVSY